MFLTKPITANTLAKHQGVEEVLEEIDSGWGLAALVRCGGIDDLPKSSPVTIPPVGQGTLGDTTRVSINPYVFLGKPNASKEKRNSFSSSKF